MKRRDLLKLAGLLFTASIVQAAGCSYNLARENYLELNSETNLRLRYRDSAVYLQRDTLRIGLVDKRYNYKNKVSVCRGRDLSQHEANPLNEDVAVLAGGKIYIGKNIKQRKDLPEIIKKLREFSAR